MIKQEVIEKISKYFKLTQFEAEKIYDDIFSIIIKGVKDDNVTDVTNFGEFVTKYNNGRNGNGNGNGSSEHSNGYKRTVEFLASTNLEEEINQTIKENTKPGLETLQKMPMNTEELSSVNGASTIEDEFRKKREALLNKISIHPLQDSAKEKKQREKPAIIPIIKEEPVTPEPEITGEIPPEKTEIIDEKVNDTVDNTIEETAIEEISAEPEPEKPVETTEDISQKSFSDYFSEIKTVPEPEITPIDDTFTQEPHVIPQSAVELHNEITHPLSGPVINPSLISDLSAPQEEIVLSSPAAEDLGETVEHVNEDKSYYIWYKDSEANVSDTQTMSYEYELLYQATKEAEYKSKVRIYVSTFIVFFSIVLVMLIFSPVIYKIFFSPEDQNVQMIEPQNTEEADQSSTQNNVQEPVIQTQSTEQQSNDLNKPVQQEQPPATQQQTQEQAKQQEQPKQQEQVPPAAQQQNQQQPPQQQKQQEQQQPPQQQKDETSIAGVTKNTMGWADEKFKVIYIKLDNGKFTIQESAWDSDAKANKRISAVDGFKINGLKGNVVRADLGDKGVWFRARFGEFSTIEEARVKAEELRNKERMRFQALLACFLLFA
ncbi:MAG: hypothetical protein EHM58_07890 [Ignavibacteriae bacterium]|nr:MAG: hypothetical protein EHM58_07890 [Ignavibacteriota bacterium]